jgi:Haem-binding domain
MAILQFDKGTSLIKVIALTILLLMLALIAFGNSLSRKQTTETRNVHDDRYADPFRGSEGGKTLARACGNCHSNQTKLPWYGHVVPISWWIDRHVREGRQALNFTEWTTYSARRQHDELESICGVVSNGRMPPASYKVLHRESRLEAEDKKLICAWAANEWEREK